MFIREEELEELRKNYRPGDKVKLIQMDDIQAPPPGTRGKVTYVDDAGNIHIAWETGSSLSAIYNVDIIEKIQKRSRQ